MNWQDFIKLDFDEPVPHVHTVSCGEGARRTGGLVIGSDARKLDANVAFDFMIFCASAAHNASIAQDWKKAKAYREQYQLWAEIAELAAMRDED